MNKAIIGALVGGLILFIWQFLSWAALNLHASQMEYTPKQTEILEYLSNNLEEGEYFLPTVPKGATSEQMTALQENAIGKPWAKIQMNDTFDANMGMNMFRGFVVNVLSAFLLCWILMKIPNRNFVTILLSSLFVGLISYMNTSYINSIWFETNSIPDLLDAVASWGIVGLALGAILKVKDN